MINFRPSAAKHFRTVTTSSASVGRSKQKKEIPMITADEFLLHSTNPTATVHLNNLQRHRQLGPVYSESFGPDVSAIFVADPVICRHLLSDEGAFPQHAVPHSWTVYNSRKNIKRGLLFLDGPDWWRLRKKMNPLFMKTDAVKQIASCSSPLTQELMRVCSEQEVPNLEMCLHRWSVEAMLANLFGDLYYSGEVAKLLDVDSLIHNVHTMFKTSARLQLVSSTHAAQQRSPLWLTFENAADQTLASVNQLTMALMDRALNGLVYLMRTQADLEQEEICRLSSDFIIAAADTTSYTATWCLYLLATHADPQAKARQEAQTETDVAKMRYIRWVNREAMRLFPVAPFITRILPQPLSIAGYELPANTLILLSTYAMSRQEEHFDKVDQFWPERWERLEGATGRFRGASAMAPFATLPFGYGIRSCIGKRLAEHQLAYLVAQAVSRFRMRCLNQHPVQMSMRLIGIPDQTVRIHFSSSDAI